MTKTMNDQQLAAIRDARDAAADAKRHLDELVLEAFEGGASYAQLGFALGISRQAMQQRFHGTDNY